MSTGAGEYNRKIIIAERTATKDALNQPIDLWLPKYTPWAKILSATGMAAVRASQEGLPTVPTKYSFRIRYKPVGITTAMRVEYKGLFYDIRDIRHDHDRKDHTDLVCELGGNSG